MEKSSDSSSSPLLSPPTVYGVPCDPPPTYIILPVYPRRRRRRRCSACCGALFSSSALLTTVFFLVVLAAASFFLWPSDPTVSIARLRLDRLRVSTSPFASIDVSLGLDLTVQNRAFFSLDYGSIKVAVGYRGQRLGSVTSDGGHIRARGVSYVESELRVDGARVINEIFYLIEDLASGSIPFHTVTEVEGQLHLFFIDVPIKGRLSCAVHVNPEDQTVIHQDCYPEGRLSCAVHVNPEDQTVIHQDCYPEESRI